VNACYQAYKVMTRCGNDVFNQIVKGLCQQGAAYIDNIPDKKKRAANLYPQAMEPFKRELDTYAEAMPHLDINVNHGKGLKHENGRSIKDVRPVFYISSGLYPTRKSMWQALFKDDITITLKKFYETWRTWFPNYFIKRFIPFAKCEECAGFQDRLLGAASEEEKTEQEVNRKGHRQLINVARTRLWAREQVAVLCPHAFEEIMIDGMDCGKTYVPKEGEKDTSTNVFI
jgi:hypothetical protein